MSKGLASALLLISALSGAVHAGGCPEMTRNLTVLKEEYRTLAKGSASGSKRASFGELTELLDRIISLKAEMRKAECIGAGPGRKKPPAKPKGVKRNAP